jgi:spore maturation protein CgeB
MRIACFGASLVSAYANGAATYYRGIFRALANRGHSVRFYEPIDDERLMHRDILDPAWAEIVRFAPDGEGVEAALAGAADADLIVKASTVGVFDELLDAAVPRSTPSGRLSIYWDLDPAATLARMQTEPDNPLRAQLPWYDLVVVRYGADELMEAFQALGARAVFPVYNALDRHAHHRVDTDQNVAAALTYLAHRHADRDQDVQRYFFDVAASLPARRFLLGGCGWEGASMPANVHYVGYVYTAEHNTYYSSTVAALNVTASRTARFGYCPSARFFEAVGAQACLISDAWPGVEMFLEPGRELLIAHTTADVIEHIGALGAERASAIGRRAWERSRIEHTYDRRAAELEALVEGFDRQWANRNAL